MSRHFRPLSPGRPLLPILAASAAALLLVLYLWQRWQGPLVDGYQIQQQPLTVQVVASGEVRSQSLARIGSEITGVLAQRHVREGDVVHAGDLLLEIRNDQQQAQAAELEAALLALAEVALPQAAAALREAEASLERATHELARRQTLLAAAQVSSEEFELARHAEARARAAVDSTRARLNAVSDGGSEQQQLQQRLAAARAQLAKTSIRANVDGIVQSRNAEPGDLVQPGMTLLEIARADSREIVVPVDEKIFAAIKLGQPATVIADAYPARPLAARVVFIAPAVDTARGTVNVHLQLDNQEGTDFLLQGMTITATIVAEERAAVVVVPNDALQATSAEGQATVLRVTGNRVEQVPVTLGLRGLVASEVTSGLAAGDIVLNSNAEPGTRVRVQLAGTATGN